MNGKKAKALRKLARESTVGAPERRTTDRRVNRYGVEVALGGVHRQLVGASIRGTYRVLKKMAKGG